MMIHRVKQSLTLAAFALALNACSSGSGQDNRTNPPPPDDNVTGQDLVYEGPNATTPDVLNFKQAFWDNAAVSTRCGACHIEGEQSPEFARRDDINAAYTIANGFVNLTDPASSRFVQKVASGHGCWASSSSFCAESITEWITNWAASSGVELTETALREPEHFAVGASLSFAQDPSAFELHVYPLLVDYCADCHRADAPQAPVQPYFASGDISTAYQAAQSKMLFNVTGEGDSAVIDASRSRLVVRLREEAHNCWDGNCGASANAMEQALEAFAATLPMSGVDADLVTSKAMRIGDGTAISQGGRIETNAIAIYAFKEGQGSVANDSAGDTFPPEAPLNLSGSVEWVSNWGIRLNDGRAQAPVSLSRKFHQYITQTGEYSIEAWVIPANVTQDGPARIVTYSGSNTLRNFTLGQTLYNYNFFNRASTTDINGAPTVSTPDADEVLQATLQHVVASYDPLEGRRIYVNGSLVSEEDPSGAGNFNNWDDTFALVLGNETSGEYPWRGTIRFLAIHNRALSEEQAATNYDVGVGQKILVAFSVAEHISGMDDAYIVFQVEQFDDYSYLFSEPYFFSFSEQPLADITIEGLRIGVNGREATVGQVYANLNATISATDYNPEGVPLSELGAIIQAEKGPEQDQFFLSFDAIGASSYSRAAPPIQYPTEAEDLPAQPRVGIRTFAEINASLSAMTGIPVTHPDVTATYNAVEQQMPVNEDVRGFLVAHQMGITQLAVKYCNTLASEPARSAAFFPDFAGVFDTPGRDAVVNPLLAAMLAHTVESEGVQLADQPVEGESRARLNSLIDTMTANCSAGTCSDTVTRNTLTATCAAALGSAVMLVQ